MATPRGRPMLARRSSPSSNLLTRTGRPLEGVRSPSHGRGMPVERRRAARWAAWASQIRRCFRPDRYGTLPAMASIEAVFLDAGGVFNLPAVAETGRFLAARG